MTSVVGIDLGSQSSLIAAAGRGGVDVILNGNSQRLNPTMVGFDESRKMGEAAMSGVSSNYKNTVTGNSLKRLIGLAFDDPRAQREMKHSPLTFVPISHPDSPPSVGVKVTLGGTEQIIAMEAALGMMLQHLGDICASKAQAAEPGLSLRQLAPQDWVIAIPPYFTDSQRRAVLTACDIAGIRGVNRLMHETTATALAFGIFKDLKKEFAETPGLVMFIDMGASAYTVSIASFEPGRLLVKSVQADPDLGGRDFDTVVAQWIADQFEEKFKNKLVSGKPMTLAKTRMKLFTAAEQAKKTLSPVGVKEARINLEMLQDDLDFSTVLTAEIYEKLCEPLLARLAQPILGALAEAGNLNAAKDLTAIEIVGGSTRIGCVKRQLVSILGGSDIVLSTTMNADEAVARGAALQSAILSPRFKVLPYEIIEAQPFPIKLTWGDGSGSGGVSSSSGSVEVDATGETEPASDSVVMFDRGLAFPIVRRVTLKRSGTFVVHAVYDATPASCPLGFSAGAVSPRIADFHIVTTTKNDETKVRVNVKTDIHGIVHLSSAQMVEEIEDEDAAAAAGGETAVAGEEKKKKIKKTNLECTTRRPLEWTTDEINRAHEEDVAMANTDRIVKETADMRNELESYIYDMRDKVVSDSQLGLYGTAEEKAAFVAKNESVENWLYEDGFDAKKSAFAEKLTELKALGGPMEKRQSEAMGRAAAVSTLQSTIALYSQWVNNESNSDAFSHVTDAERETVRTLLDTTSSWMYETLDKQGGLAPHQDAVLTMVDLTTKNISLNTMCGPIMRKPVPKKVDVPKKEDPPPAPAAPAADAPDAGQSMDVDTEGEGGTTTPMQTD